MKRVLYIVGLICISLMDVSGQPNHQSKDLLKGLLGTDFQKLGELNSKLYCDVISVNGELTRGMIYNDSATYSIKYWFSNDFDFKEAKLIEFEIVKIDTSKTQCVWVKVVTAWTKENEPKKWSLDKKTWNFSKKNIEVRLPTTSYSYVGVQKLNGESVRQVIENPLTCKPIAVNIDKKSIGDNEVIVAYFESDDKVYIAYYKG
jgi:hypothetical protein